MMKILFTQQNWHTKAQIKESNTVCSYVRTDIPASEVDGGSEYGHGGRSR